MSTPAADSTKNVEQKCSQRKINKPLIEKRRRARINDCLAQLKTIVLEANESKSPRPSKLEKADILEMTVEFVKTRLTGGHDCKKGQTTNDDSLDYVAGYSKCLSEISKFLEQTKPEHYTLQQDIVDHVSEKLRSRIGKDGRLGQTLKKLPIAPLCKTSREQKCLPDEAIDLRIGNCDSTEQGKAISVDGGNTKELTIKKPASDLLVNQSTPIGLLCGGQVMLLVQLPQTVTSQSITVQNVQSVNQSQNSLSMIGIQPLSLTSQTQLTQFTGGSDPNSYNPTSIVQPRALVSDNQFQPLQNKNITHSVIQNNSGLGLNQHWRPW